MCKRTFEELEKDVKEIRELVEKEKEINKLNDENKKWFFLQDVRNEIIMGIMAGNFYNFNDAVVIADRFGLPQEDWSAFGCPAYD